MPVDPKLEAEPYATVELQVEQGPGSHAIHQVEFALEARVEGLKQDVSYMIGIPATEQKWYHQGVLIKNDTKLQDYGISVKLKAYIIVKR